MGQARAHHRLLCESTYLLYYDNPNPNLNNYLKAYILRLTANGLASNAVHHTITATDLRAPMLDFVTLLVSVYLALDHLLGMVPCQGTLKHSHETRTHASRPMSGASEPIFLST